MSQSTTTSGFPGRRRRKATSIGTPPYASERRIVRRMSTPAPLVATTLLAHPARELAGERPHGLTHLTELDGRCGEHVDVFEPSRRDEPGAAARSWDLSRSRPRISSASIRRYCSRRRDEVVAASGAAHRIAVDRRRPSRRHRGDEQVRQVERTQHPVDEVPLAALGGVHARKTIDGIDSEEAKRVDIGVAEGIEQRTRKVTVSDAESRCRSTRELESVGRIESVDPVDPPDLQGIRSTAREALVEEGHEDREVFGSFDRVACIAVRRASRSTRST